MTSSAAPAPLHTPVTELLGVAYPIVQAPMGWIARSQLASAVSNAGGMGIIETSSGELDAVRAEILKMRDLTDKPFGVNIAQAFVRDPGIAGAAGTVPGRPAVRTARGRGAGADRVRRPAGPGRRGTALP